MRMAPPKYREPYPTWIMVGMDVLAAGILVASFRDAWSVVSSLGDSDHDWANSIVAGAVVLAIDASILLLEQARSQVKLRGGNTRFNDLWVMALIFLSAVLNVRYLTAGVVFIDQIIGALLGIAIPMTIAVLGYIKGDMLAYNAQSRQSRTMENVESMEDEEPEPAVNAWLPPPVHGQALAKPEPKHVPEEGEPAIAMFRLKR